MGEEQPDIKDGETGSGIPGSIIKFIYLLNLSEELEKWKRMQKSKTAEIKRCRFRF